MSSGHVPMQKVSAERSAPWHQEMAIVVFVEAMVVCVLVIPWPSSSALAVYSAASAAGRLVAASCILRGLIRYKPEHRFVWVLLMLRCAWSAVFIPLRGAFIADQTWWAADIAAGTLLYVIVAAVLVFARAAARDRSLWIDIVAICVGAAFGLYAYLGGPLLARVGLSTATLLTGVVAPSLDVVLLAMTLLLAFTWRDRNVALGLLITAFALVPPADIVVQLAQLEKLHLIATHSVPFGVIFTAMFALAALHPSMRLVQSHTSEGLPPWGAPRSILIVVAFLLALGGLLYRPATEEAMPQVLVAGVLAIMFLLIVWRAHLAMRSLVASRERIHHLATHDSVTGLPNFMGLAEAHANTATQVNGHRSLLLLRLSQLHEVGQLWGITLRDTWIARVATMLTAATANAGQLARVGTDQFALLTPVHGVEPGALDRLAQRMAESVRGVQSGSDQLGYEAAVVSAFDIGIASALNGTALDTLLRDAESAISIAHTQGENHIAHYDASVAASEHRRLTLLTNLHGAVERNEFTLRYQPVVDMATRDVMFYEALLRWRTAERGDVPPTEFIPLAESIDVIEEITDWVMHTAFAALAASSVPTTNGYRISINISARSLQRPGLARRVTIALERHNLRPADVCLELTERTQMKDPHGELGLLREHGVAIAIDDFGSGYSNIEMLARLTSDAIKLDIDFVRAIEAKATMRDLCRSLLAHVNRSGTRVIAEGIETEAQHNLLSELGCHYGQGWLYGRPSPRLGATDEMH